MNERLTDPITDSPATDLSAKEAVGVSFGLGLTAGVYAEMVYLTKAVFYRVRNQ